MSSILVINGPNLNLLGQRETSIYGSMTLDEINAGLQKQAKQASLDIQFLQSNAEHEIVNRVHQAGKEGIDMIIINAASLTHTSIALRDALLGVKIPFIEVHISNVYAREEFRKHSYLSDIAAGCIVGLGTQGYALALQAAINQLSKTE